MRVTPVHDTLSDFPIKQAAQAKGLIFLLDPNRENSYALDFAFVQQECEPSEGKQLSVADLDQNFIDVWQGKQEACRLVVVFRDQNQLRVDDEADVVGEIANVLRGHRHKSP